MFDSNVLKDKRIFIIEDDLSNRVIMQMLLEQAGARVAFERWGKESVAKLEAFAPVDIILLDLMFPQGVTGYDIFDNIRAEEDFNAIPIVAVSASDSSEAIPKTKEKGFRGFIPKPVSYDEFPNQIAKILAGETIWIDN